MLQKLLSWFLFLGIFIVNLGVTWWFWLGYNLFIPHSNIVYTGWAYWSWKLLLVQALFDIALLVVHLIFSGKALLQGDTRKARKISLVVLLILSIQLFFSFIRQIFNLS